MTLPNMTTPDSSQPESAGPAGSLRTTAIVLYVTLGLLAATIPQALVNWLHDMNDNAAVRTLGRGAEAMQNVSEKTGLAVVYRRARDVFIALSGVEPD